MKTVAVLGGGPAGATAAERLARSGLRTIVLDEKLAWEKPCGGGITYKAYSQYPYLLENDTPKKIVTDTTLAAPKSGAFYTATYAAFVDLFTFGSERHALEARRSCGR